MAFWIIVGVMTLILGGIAFYPLLRKPSDYSQQKRDALNKAFYFDRLQEVEQEFEQGKIEDAEQAKLELQQSLLDDIPAQGSPATVSKSHWGKVGFMSLIALIGVVGGGVYWQVGSWFSGTMLEKSHQKLAYFYERIKSEESEPLSEQELNQFAVALRVELQKTPQDDKSWFMLGQLGMALDDGQLALDSFSKASQLQPDNLQYKLRYAQVLLFSADPKDKEQGENVLKEVIRVDHTNVEALGLLAFNAFEKEDYKMAAMTWGMMLKLMPEDDSRRPTIERSIQSALSMEKDNTK
ncbi:c-type cytochrome biogenesis protein CcmI [Muribacter muris]|uniref:C-type cytochrome biogenesis protein CcmI n=1 Tax=Muribacter muris TaxID=67855 RepID=A0A4Y9JSM2_9PAST|nr:c-type cytochrome biogenesis protein CcmI [Muribacter muris]MBF0785870.1 c-type cytochrome biogenesis protein CcmI [Muribacter muris]MBF0827216.1 c-type cytochrome biogenesis protein CcmI [Muribacter muris]TFV08312.1 c-type cytochrome biogenesis protein CcmI [Muribacter muris]